MPTISDVPTPAGAVHFPRVEPPNLASDGSRQGGCSRNWDRLAGWQSSVVSLQVVDHPPHDGRDRTPRHREVHVSDSPLDNLPENWESLQPTVPSGTASSAALVGSSQK